MEPLNELMGYFHHDFPIHYFAALIPLLFLIRFYRSKAPLSWTAVGTDLLIDVLFLVCTLRGCIFHGVLADLVYPNRYIGFLNRQLIIPAVCLVCTLLYVGLALRRYKAALPKES